MTQGRYICNTLKAIRKEIADANDIRYEPHECQHEGPCLGTCPACEAEVLYLEHELDVRRHLGKAVAVVGLSVGLAGLVSGCASKKRAAELRSHNGSDAGVILQGDVVEPPILAGIPAIPDDILQQTDSAELKPVATAADDKIFGDSGEQMPMFRGGATALEEYIAQNLRYPENYDVTEQGRVIVSFWIERDGSVSGAEVLRSSDERLNQEALRLVGGMPKWFPGRQGGKSIRVKYTMPVKFQPR